MFGWFKIKSPLTADQRRWIEERFDWLRGEFGEDRLESPIITPTSEYFPDRYAGTVEDAAVLFDRVCKYMDVDRARVDLRFYKSPSADVVAAALNPALRREYALGVYQEREGGIDIWLETSSLREAASVIATLAHELGHVHLLADGRCHEKTEDHEPLTDLLVVYFGMGIFIANSTLREVTWTTGQLSGWQMSKQGYMSLAEHAYALALYADARNEHAPRWARHLRRDVRALFGIDLKHLAKGTELPVANPVQDVTTNAASDDESNSSDFEPDHDEPDGDEPDGDDPDGDESDGDAEGHPSDERDAEFHDANGLTESAREGSADDFFTHGVTHAAREEHELAIEAFTQAIRLSPRDGEAWLCRAKSNLAIQRYRHAIEDCSECLRLDSTDVSATYHRATAYLWLRQFDDAMRDMNGVIRAQKKDPNAWQLRGLAYMGLKQFEEAIQDLNQAVRHAPTWATTYLARSRARAALGDRARAQADLNEAIRRDPNLSDESRRAACLAGRT